MGVLELASALASAPPQPAYMLLGAERFLRNAALSALRKHLLGDSPGYGPIVLDVESPAIHFGGFRDRNDLGSALRPNNRVLPLAQGRR